MQKDDYWFQAKRYGWGWGLPLRWQGWIVYGVALVLLVSVFLFFPPHRSVVPFLIGTWAVLLALVAVCWLKGEPPRWRWGK
ncbi:hypothetical protein [Pseudoxanthomonas japonensis]|uniref:hypothetical protein n=1 Tax=Pseudoxanthomonas japonensis TaxID=69284 RepID=UPI001BCEA757|nr:hypothetical protein [Pseudoxanthomonas japonensis]MCR6625892.1 hypothetical protein [Pseudoxanthomonas sp.]